MAILTTATFDATDVDPDTVTFAGASPKRSGPKDVDGDGDTDLILHFRTQETDISPGDTQACLQGETFSGQPFQGCDSVRLVPPLEDGDTDSFSDDYEASVGTDQSAACPRNGGHDAWPPDVTNDGLVDSLDALAFVDHAFSDLGSTQYDARFDLRFDGRIDQADILALWSLFERPCLDPNGDYDGDGLVNSLDSDDDGDGFTDIRERSMATDDWGSCSASSGGHDAWAPDRDRDGDADIGDVIANFIGKLFTPAAYDARSDPDADGDIDIGDVITFYQGNILTECAEFTFTNNTGSKVDNIHIEWSAPVIAVFSALDSDPVGWPNRTLSGGGLSLDVERPNNEGDLANSGQLTIVVKVPMPGATIISCQWALHGNDKGEC